MNNKPHYINQLQPLRFIAFTLIFMQHANIWLPNDEIISRAAMGAISFFIIISGYLTGYNSYYSDNAYTFKKTRNDIFNFLSKYYPLYIVTIMLGVTYTLIPGFFTNMHGSIAEFQFKSLIPCIFLLQAWTPVDTAMFNGIAWFMSLLLFLIACRRFLLAFANKFKSQKNETFLLVFFISTIFILELFFCFELRNTDVEFTIYTFPISRIIEYSLGLFVGFLFRKTSENIKLSAYIATILELISILFWIVAIIVPCPIWLERTFLWIIPNLMLIITFTVGHGVISNIFRYKPLVYLGNITFESYIIHLLVLKYYWTNTGIADTTFTGALFSFLFCYIVTILIGSILHKPK